MSEDEYPLLSARLDRVLKDLISHLRREDGFNEFTTATILGAACQKIRKIERERCARIAESLGPLDHPITGALYSANVAEAIRKSGEP